MVSCVAADVGSTSTGGAKTVAVAEITAGWLPLAISNADAIAAPTGSRGAADLALFAGLRRTGANASAALHPCEEFRAFQ